MLVGLIASAAASEGHLSVRLLIPSIAFLVGVLSAHRALVQRGSPAAEFIAVFLIQISFLLILFAGSFIPGSIVQFWPLSPFFAGTALAVVGFRSKNRSRYFIPAIAFAILGLFFLPFSLGLSTVGLRAFFIEWAPFLFILSGAALSLISMAARVASSEDPRP